MGGWIRSGLRGHALTAFNGLFLTADDAFRDIVGLDARSLQASTILDVTHPGDRSVNHDKLNRLRTLETPFEIVKRYVRPDGKVVRVRNHVAPFRDGLGPIRIVASVKVLDPLDPPEAERRRLLLAETLLRDRMSRTTDDSSIWSRRHGDTLLALYILEERGAATLFGDICATMAIDESEGCLTLLELMAENLVEMDKRGTGLPDSGAILTAKGRTALTRHFEIVQPS